MVARKYKVPVKTVRRWVQKLDTVGSVATKVRSGRPSSVDREMRKFVRRQLLGGKATCRDISGKLASKGKAASTSSVWRTAVSGKRPLKLKTVKYKPFLTPEHKSNRLAFARANRGRDWSRVIFTDSKYWVYHYAEGIVTSKRWSQADEQPVVKVAKSKQQVHAYAGICPGRGQLACTW